MKPLVSIIIPAFNEQKNIARAIGSALSQSLKCLEIIVIDDGSTDSTAHIVTHCALLDNRVRLISHKSNKGLSQSRLDGINEATGNYIFFLDADDTITPNAIKSLYNTAVATSCDIVIGGARRITRRFGLSAPFFRPQRYFNTKIYHAIQLLPQMLAKQGFPVNVWGRLYSRDLLISRFIEAEKSFMGEDFILNARVFNSEAEVTWIDDITYNWTMGGASSLSPKELWAQNQDIYSRLFQILGPDSEFIVSLNQGLENDLTAVVAQIMGNPFYSRRCLLNWLKQQLNMCQPISSSATTIILNAKKIRAQHRLFYWAMPLLSHL